MRQKTLELQKEKIMEDEEERTENIMDEIEDAGP